MHRVAVTKSKRSDYTIGVVASHINEGPQLPTNTV